MMEKGMWRYVLFHGILRFGLVFGILGVLTNVLFVRDNLFIAGDRIITYRRAPRLRASSAG